MYADEGITGTSAEKRTEFQRLIKDCKRGKIDRIYAKSISRFARNTKDCLKNVRFLRELGISIVFEEDNIDTAEITIPFNIQKIGNRSFTNCIRLKTATIINPDFEVDAGCCFGIIQNSSSIKCTIKGYDNSTAETYARPMSHLTFESLGEAYTISVVSDDSSYGTTTSSFRCP
ncbi:MAG: recombinase family protein [Ruminococcus sp.]|nr:recombinase family protein [Ruminococcus sp.]